MEGRGGGPVEVLGLENEREREREGEGERGSV